MASSEFNLQVSNGSDPSGYKYEFKDKIPEDFLCQRCKHVAREPNLTSCCTESFCKDCISPYIHDNQHCPSCGDKDFVIFLNKKIQKKIQSMLLYCPMKSHGCEWTGRLEQLESHMDVQSGDCLYVDVECPSHCHQRVQKRNFQNHLSWECPLREYTCPHCNFKASYKIISEDHLEVCSYLPVQCPNRCGVTCEREDLEDHMKICDKEELECCFSHAGCQGRFLREDEERHMEKNTKKHLSLMATAMLKISTEMEKSKEMAREKERIFHQRLQEQDTMIQTQEMKFREILQEKDAKLKEQDMKLQAQEKMFEEKLRQQEKRLQEQFHTHGGAADINGKIQELQFIIGHAPPFPVTFTMPFFEQMKTEDKSWYSPLLHAYYGGYNFRIWIRPNGSIDGGSLGTHVAVLYKACPGDCDEQLKWPVTISVIFELLNQHADRDHISKVVTVTYDKNDALFIFDCKFISHRELDWNAEKETQYLKNNSLQFKVVEVRVLEQQ